MTLRRGATPLLGGGGVPTLEASNQAQIDDLVQRNRTLEHTNKKLSEQLSQEHSRSKDAILDLQSKWDVNQSKWKQSCESLLGSYRIIQQRIQVELEKERANTLNEMKITREEKLLRLQRDFKITLFQMKEEELERRVEDVEDEKTRLIEMNGLVVEKMQGKCADYVIKLRDAQASLSRTEKEMQERETKLNKLLEDRANLEASSESIKSKLERTKLQLDGAQTKNSELERLNDELKRTNTELTRQLGKWQSLETKEGEAANTERKQRIALEMELRDTTETYEKKLEQAAADLEKAKGRVERMIITVQEWEEAYQNAQAEAENAEKQLAKAHKRIEKLKSDLEVERTRNHKASTLPPDDDVPLEDEPVEIEAAPRRAKSSSVKPSLSKQITETAIQHSKSSESQERPHRRIARKSTGGKSPKKPLPQDDSEIEEIPDPNGKKGKAKATGPDEDQVRAATTRKKGKRKATSDDDDDIEVVEQLKRRRTGRAASEMKETARARAKPSSRAASKQPVAAAKPNEDKDDNGEGVDVTQKNAKKRRINIFPTGNDVIQFSFGSNLNDVLNIPTTLSPVKEDELVPNRSTASTKPYNGTRR